MSAHFQIHHISPRWPQIAAANNRRLSTTDFSCRPPRRQEPPKLAGKRVKDLPDKRPLPLS